MWSGNQLDGTCTPIRCSGRKPRSAFGNAIRHSTGRVARTAVGSEGSYPIIADALRRRGYEARVTDEVLGGNFARVFADAGRAG